MTRISPEEHYKKYKKLIVSRVSKYLWIDTYDELMSTANMGYMKAVKTYNPTLGAFSTHLYWILSGVLNKHKNTVIAQKKIMSDNNTDPIHKESQLTNMLFKETIKELSTEAKEIVDLILNMPEELVEAACDIRKNYHMTMHTLRNYLLRIKGWKYTNITITFKEIQGALNGKT